jgi:hypothetical protein
MPAPLPYIAKQPKGNRFNSFTYNTGEGYLFANHDAITFVIECWGQGGSGAHGGASLGGGGGGSGGYCKRKMGAARGTVFKWSINASGDCSVTSPNYAINVSATHGSDGSGATGGAGGTASGGNPGNGGANGAGQNGTTATSAAGGKGGDTSNGGTGGAGGAANTNGSAGNAPGGGGGGGGATAGNGASGGAARIKFSWVLPLFPVPA